LVSQPEDSGQEGSQRILGSGLAERGVAKGKKIIMAVKTPGSQVDSPASAEEGGEVRGGRGRVDREGKCDRSRHWSWWSRARSKSRAGVDIAPRISPRVSREITGPQTVDSAFDSASHAVLSPQLPAHNGQTRQSLSLFLPLFLSLSLSLTLSLSLCLSLPLSLSLSLH